MNIELRIQLLKKQIEENLAAMSNRNLSNEPFCNLSDENRIMMNELTSIYRQMNKEVDKKMDEFLSERRAEFADD
jgi:hypothetical protein